jgi:hypothetical protein
MIEARACSTVDSASASGAEPPERCGHPSRTPSKTGGVLRSTRGGWRAAQAPTRAAQRLRGSDHAIQGCNCRSAGPDYQWSVDRGRNAGHGADRPGLHAHRPAEQCSTFQPLERVRSSPASRRLQTRWPGLPRRRRGAFGLPQPTRARRRARPIAGCEHDVAAGNDQRPASLDPPPARRRLTGWPWPRTTRRAVMRLAGRRPERHRRPQGPEPVGGLPARALRHAPVARTLRIDDRCSALANRRRGVKDGACAEQQSRRLFQAQMDAAAPTPAMTPISAPRTTHFAEIRCAPKSAAVKDVDLHAIDHARPEIGDLTGRIRTAPCPSAREGDSLDTHWSPR